MKRRGVLLAIVLVMAMIGTSMGSSNVLSVFAKDVATTPAAEESKEVKRTNTRENSRTEGTNATQEVTVNFKTEDPSDGTTASDSEETTQDDQGKADSAATTTKEEETLTADKDTTEKEETFGSLTIEKKVVGNNIPEETYNIKVESAEGNNNKDLTKVTVTDTADKKELATIAKVSGTLTFTIKAGQKVELQDLSTGNYSVTEAIDDKASYTASYRNGSGRW